MCTGGYYGYYVYQRILCVPEDIMDIMCTRGYYVYQRIVGGRSAVGRRSAVGGRSAAVGGRRSAVGGRRSAAVGGGRRRSAVGGGRRSVGGGQRRSAARDPAGIFSSVDIYYLLVRGDICQRAYLLFEPGPGIFIDGDIY